jgi:hypothetical protein
MCPLAVSYRFDCVRLVDEFLPSLACGVDDGIVAVEDAVGEPVLAQILPDVLDRVQFRRAGRQEDQRHVLGNIELRGGVPAGPVEQQNGVGAPCDMPADLVEMKLHGFGVGEGQRQRCSDATRRADGAEQVGALVALVGRLARPRAPSGPLADDTVLLPDAGFILEPDLDLPAFGQVGQMRAQRAREVFLYASTISPSWPG